MIPGNDNRAWYSIIIGRGAVRRHGEFVDDRLGSRLKLGVILRLHEASINRHIEEAEQQSIDGATIDTGSREMKKDEKEVSRIRGGSSRKRRRRIFIQPSLRLDYPRNRDDPCASTTTVAINLNTLSATSVGERFTVKDN